MVLDDIFLVIIADIVDNFEDEEIEFVWGDRFNTYLQLVSSSKQL